MQDYASLTPSISFTVRAHHHASDSENFFRTVSEVLTISGLFVGLFVLVYLFAPASF